MDILFLFFEFILPLLIFDSRKGELFFVVKQMKLYYGGIIVFCYSPLLSPSSSPSSPSSPASSSSPKRLLHFIILPRIKRKQSVMYACRLWMNALSFIHPMFFSLYLISCIGSQLYLPLQGLIAPRPGPSPCHGPIPRVAQHKSKNKISCSKVY